MANKSLTDAEACFLVTGSGLGTGILAIPYAARTMSFAAVVIITAFACLVSVFLHWCVAELVFRSDPPVQLAAVFRRHLFCGRHGMAASRVFSGVLVLLLFLNLTLYLSCAAETLCESFGWPLLPCELIFYAFASLLVFFGLKAVGVGEKYSMLLMLCVLALLALLTAGHGAAARPVLPLRFDGALYLYSMIMFSLSALFSVPQIAAGLGDRARTRRAVLLGIVFNGLLTIGFTWLVRSSAAGVTRVATAGLSARYGAAVKGVCAVFVVLAMLTSFISISLAQLDVISGELKSGRRLSWLLATLPALILAVVLPLGYAGYIEIIGGIVAVIIAFLVLPAYRHAIGSGGESLVPFGKSRILLAFLLASYLAMAAGALL
jgi:amino acid permease